MSKSTQEHWLNTLLESSTLPPEESIPRLLELTGEAGAGLVVFPSAGEQAPLEWYFASDMPAPLRAWLQDESQQSTLQHIFHKGVLASSPQHQCENHTGEEFYLGDDAPTSGIIVLPVTSQGYRLGLMVVCPTQGESAFPCAYISRLQQLAGHIAQPLFVQSLRAEKKHLQKQLSEVEHLKDEFIAITSHELRTPLGLVLGHATFLREMLHEEAYLEHVKVIIQSALRIKEIIEMATQADNYQSGMARLRPQQVNLNALIETLCAARQGDAAENGIMLRFDLPPAPVNVEGDAEKIRIIVNNLLENALTFTNPGGNVVVRLSTLNDYAQIAVQDDGIGIPAEDLENIFTRFYQVESHMTRHHGGMGLGLSVARDLAELHKGRIEVSSREGEGSVFTIYLPLSE